MLLFAALVTLGLILALFALAVATGRGRRREALWATGFLLPSAIHLGLFLAAPLAFSLYMGFHRWEIFSVSKPMVGLENFAAILTGAHSQNFWRALLNTALYTVHVPVSLAIALAVALMLSRCARSRGILQTVFFLPNLCLLTAVAVVWKWIYNPDFGLLNGLLRSLGLDARTGWLTSPALVAGIAPLPLLSIMAMAIWTTIGVQAVIYVAGLRAIPETYYDAARVDGANAWQTFWHVTLPLLKPTTLFLLVTSVIASFQVFASIYIMVDQILLRTHRVDVLVYQVYDYAWGTGNDLGLASALSWILFLIILSVTVVLFRLIGREAHEG